MWIQLSDDALRRAESVLRKSGEKQSANTIQRYLEDASANDAIYDSYRKVARNRLSNEDDVDSDAVVSCGDDPGGYVMCWLWVRDSDAGIQSEPGTTDEGVNDEIYDPAQL